jgi:hypothetical protein
MSEGSTDFADHCRQSSHQGLGFVFNDACTDAEGKGRSNNKTWAGKRSVGSCSTCAVRCVLLRERAEAKRRGELELMRNEQDDGGQTEID